MNNIHEYKRKILGKFELKFWCENQSIDIDKHIICLAHLAEDRVLDCPYNALTERKMSRYPCSDYKPKE